MTGTGKSTIHAVRESLQRLAVLRDVPLRREVIDVFFRLLLPALFCVQQASHAAVEIGKLLLLGDRTETHSQPRTAVAQWTTHVQPLDH